MSENAVYENESVDIRTVADLLSHLSGTRASGALKWYRGQSDFGWGLVPKVARNSNHVRHELDMLKTFKKDASDRLGRRPQTAWEWIVVAQHYGLPTRLLDWSENPLIALYFAAGNSDPSADGAIFELDPASLNNSAFEDAPDVVMLDEDDFLDGYLPSAPKGPRRGPLAVVCGRTFDRIIAQSGTFTLNHFVSDNIEALHGGPHTTRLRIPLAAKPSLRAELSDMNINESTVYPDPVALARHLEELYK